MSNVHFTLVFSRGYSSDSKPIDAPASRPIGVGETIPSSTSVQETDLEATAAITRQEGKAFWRVANAGTDDVYVAFAEAGDLTTQTHVKEQGFLMPAGSTEYFHFTQYGEVGVVINV
jgi:hypothetical protein